MISTFKVTPAMEQKYTDWINDRSRSRVVELVMKHETRYLYQLTLADVKKVCDATEHALGLVKRKEAESVVETRNWFPEFAFTHIMHHYLETRRSLPTWQNFYHFLFYSDEGNSLIGIATRWHKAERLAGGVSEKLARDALRWRFGNAYYSFLREVHMLVYLRENGFDVRSHPLADALFRIDGWMGDAVISIWVANENFRREKGFDPQGRKDRVKDLLAGSVPSFRFVDIELDKAEKWGCVHLSSDSALEKAKAKLVAARK
ncbi:hypothetical protein [Amycolatopsis sp. NPDC003861]